jgi:hypothetical protein
MTRIADIIDVPRQVHRGDFVLKLSEGVVQAEETLRTYVVTPQLVQCFDEALGLIRSAVQQNRSKGAYLHGSFGSGKSHFMAVLTLLLRGNSAARSVRELVDVVAKHNAWTQEKKVLVVPYHLIGATSLESAVLGQYAAFVRRMHPRAPTPGFYRAERLFEDAQRLRQRMGDEPFFRELGARSGGDDAWGALDASWDASAFDNAIEEPPGSEERARLVGDLVDTFFSAQRDLAAGQQEGFVPLDEGLVVLSRHARDLGYDGVVLFLDELVLWLASHAADPAFVNREGQKVTKLVEAAQMDRPIPVVSFIARQRDLRELVGEHMPGAQQLGFADVLNWWEARFDRITLEDRNLPAIIERRLLKPKSAEAEQRLEEAFEATAAVREDVLNTLLTREGDRAMFRQVYPFSPALINTLVALSSLLQRERTALKLLMQLLVDQRETLQLGDLVPVGDLYDVIESGDEPFTQAMKLRFEQARRLYRLKLIPLLQEQHQVTLEAIEAGKAPEDRARAFRNDARLLKTLILASLAEGVEALKALTPTRLAALNHGTVRTPVPGMESQVVLNKVRNWAARVGEIKVGDDARNPIISLHLVGVDTEGIVENAKAFDNHGNRIQKIRQLLHGMLGLQEEESLLPAKHRLQWRGTTREAEVLVRNVRDMPLDLLPPQASPWRILIDYPFDVGEYGPRDDFAKIQKFHQEQPPANTIVWLPAFLTPAALNELGQLVLLDHILSGNKLDEYGAHLSQIDREQARILLVNQRDQIRQRVRGFLLAAYGVSTVHRDAIDDATELESPFHSLEPGLHLRPPVAASLQAALESLLDQALQYQYPAHPQFEGDVRPPGLRKVWEVVQRAAERPDRRVEVDRNLRDDVRRIAVPLHLGQMGESAFVLRDDWVREFEQRRAQDGASDITVKRLREWLDRPRPRGLPADVENLVILTWALQTNRSFYLHGGLVEPTLDKVPGELELREEALPDEEQWGEAVERAQAILGLTVPALRSGSGVARLVEEARKEAGDRKDALTRYVRELEQRLPATGVELASADRLSSARAAQAFATAIAEARRDHVVAAIARAEVATSQKAMGMALKLAPTLEEALSSTRWDLLRHDEGLAEPFRSRLSQVVDRARDALRHDEHVAALDSTLRQAEREAIRILQDAARAAAPPPAPRGQTESEAGPGTGPAPPGPPSVMRRQRRVRAAEVRSVLDELREEAVRRPDAWVEIEWRIVEE